MASEEATKPQDGAQLLQVPWQVVLGGLFAFALNSITQPAGQVCGAPSDISFQLRSSPIICVIDTVLIISRFIYFRCTSASWWVAHSRLLRFRFQEEVEGDRMREGTLRNLQKNTVVRLIVFAFAVTQMIKIYAYGGLVWTKVIASMYLVSFLVVEGLIALPQAIKPYPIGKDREQELATSGVFSIPYISVAFAIAFLLAIASTAARHVFNQSQQTLIMWLAIVLLTYASLFVLGAFCFSIVRRRSNRDMLWPVSLLVALVGLSTGSILASRSLVIAEIPQIGLLAIYTSVLALFIAIMLKLVTSSLASILYVQGQDNTRHLLEQSASYYMVLLHIVTAVLYYRYAYDAKGTSKQPWTENLP